ncbi:MAG: VOC family protein [Bryobacterales bacterium]|nr:VOC family protein [Bryobacterales bacterium]
MKQRISPCIWFDKEAIEAAEFYASVFPNSNVTFKTQIKGTPSGDCEIVGFRIMGFGIQAISSRSPYKPTPSISIMVNFDPSHDKDARIRINEVWEHLSIDGKILMPLDQYEFSERYGWVEDKYGFSWQLVYTGPEGEGRPLVIPALLFVSEMCDKAEEATDFYLSLFRNAKRGAIARYPAGMEPNKEGAFMFTDFTLEGQWFAAMDGSTDMHDFAFNEAISLVVNCEDQMEIDYYWANLSAFPKAEQCGWVRDKYGVSWQILPTSMNKWMSDHPDKIVPEMLKMRKIIIADLERAIGL